MKIDFQEPSLEVKELIRNSETSGDSEPLREYLVSNSNVFLYRSLGEKHLFNVQRGDIPAMQKKNKQVVKELQDKVESEDGNDTELFKAKLQLAEHYARTMQMKEFDELIAQLLDQEPSLSFKMDVILCRIRFAIILDDYPKLIKYINDGNSVYESTCDWDRKNRFKVYLGLYNLLKVDFKTAADYFKDSLSTHDACELFSIRKSVLYFIFCALLTYNRKEFKQLVLDNSEVRKYPEYTKFANAYYECNYSDFFVCLLEFIEIFQNDCFTGDYKEHFCKEMKLAGYKQLLHSYQSLHLEKMADAFGVRTKHLELDLIQFISDSRLKCAIDRIDGVVRVISNLKEDKMIKIAEKGEVLLRRIKRNIL